MVDYASGTLLGDYNGPASFDRMEARVRSTGSVAAALERRRIASARACRHVILE